MAERRNRRPHALELPELNGLSFPLTTHWTTEPERLLPYVNYMARAGLIQQDTDDWRDLFFETVSGGAGS